MDGDLEQAAKRVALAQQDLLTRTVKAVEDTQQEMVRHMQKHDSLKASLPALHHRVKMYQDILKLQQSGTTASALKAGNSVQHNDPPVHQAA